MAGRVYDLGGLQFGTSPALGSPTQIRGPRTLSETSGRRKITSSTDFARGRGAQNKGAFYCNWSIDCEDVASWATQLGLWESSFARAIQFQGMEEAATTAQNGLIKRAVLTSSGLSITKDNYASVKYGGEISADTASDSLDDEVTMTAAQVKLATIPLASLGFRVHTAALGALSIPKVTGLDVNVTGDGVLRPSGDDDYGETIIVPELNVDGKITLQDHTISAAESLAQRLIEAATAALTFKIRIQDGSDLTFTLANCDVFEAGKAYQSKGMANINVMYSLNKLDNVSPSNIYQVATGTHKLITVA